jgi:hypothetical protein
VRAAGREGEAEIWRGRGWEGQRAGHWRQLEVISDQGQGRGQGRKGAWQRGTHVMLRDGENARQEGGRDRQSRTHRHTEKEKETKCEVDQKRDAGTKVPTH